MARKTCFRCGKPLTGQQEKWCGHNCAVLGWRLQNHDQWLSAQAKANKKHTATTVRLIASDLARLDRIDPDLSNRLRNDIADAKLALAS